MSTEPFIFNIPNELQAKTHYYLSILGALLAAVTFICQWIKPAPYGKFQNIGGAEYWGPLVPQRIAHMLSDAVAGIALFFLILFHNSSEEFGLLNTIFIVIYQVHQIHRGLIHPLLMKYSSRAVPLGISLGNFLPCCLYNYLNGEFLAYAKYDEAYLKDVRFISGLSLYIVGFCINRSSDWKLRSLRKTAAGGSPNYLIPTGGLFEFISCPNYFGEGIQWLGWSIATWSTPGLVWFLFCMATFIPRSRDNHKWYQLKFENYPTKRRALIPFVF